MRQKSREPYTASLTNQPSFELSLCTYDKSVNARLALTLIYIYKFSAKIYAANNLCILPLRPIAHGGQFHFFKNKYINNSRVRPRLKKQTCHLVMGKGGNISHFQSCHFLLQV